MTSWAVSAVHQSVLQQAFSIRAVMRRKILEMPEHIICKYPFEHIRSANFYHNANAYIVFHSFLHKVIVTLWHTLGTNGPLASISRLILYKVFAVSKIS